MKILDVSKYQPNIMYTETAKDVDGVILRIGLTYWGAYNMGKDECFDAHYKGFKNANVPIGVYYYSCADTVERAKNEAEYVLSLVKDLQLELPIFYDVENNERQGKLTKEQLTEIVDTFCSIVESKGYYVGYYSYTAWLLTKFDTNYLSNKYSLWKADYRTTPDTTIPCDMLQYTSSGSVKGIDSRVDLNNCYVDYESIIKKAGLNGFDKEDNTPYIPFKLLVGFASAGDIYNIGSVLADNSITYINGEEGYLIVDIFNKKDYTITSELCEKLVIPFYVYEEIEIDYKELYEELEDKYNSLSSDYDTLETVYNSLRTDIKNILIKYERT